MKKGIEDLINIFQLSNRAKGLSDDTLIYYSMQLNYFSNFLKTVGISRIAKIDKTTIANYVDYIVNIKKVSNTGILLIELDIHCYEEVLQQESDSR